MSLSYRLGNNKLFQRPNEGMKKPKRVVFLSAEGTETEVCYWRFIESYREQLGIDALVHVEVLRKYDTNSDTKNVFQLLEEYVQFRQGKQFESFISSLELKNYTLEFIKTYLNEQDKLSKNQINRFEAVLRENHINLLYLDFLNKYHGEDDRFGIVIDRDHRSHTPEQMRETIEKCEKQGYLYYITNPCIEF